MIKVVALIAQNRCPVKELLAKRHCGFYEVLVDFPMLFNGIIRWQKQMVCGFPKSHVRFISSAALRMNWILE